jgi:cell division inhibitor SepF
MQSHLNEEALTTTPSRMWGARGEVLILEPTSFDEIPALVQALMDQKSVLLNLNAMADAQAQRIIDFMAGATFMIEGHQERIDDFVFLFTPKGTLVHRGDQQGSPQPPAAAGIEPQSFVDDVESVD